jgi:two-component system, OmpR family, phosphate regulon sensor histidine kinase PhoR
MIMLMALPVSYFIIKQASELNENETLVQQAFEQQLETILFTINQNSENYIVSWVNQLNVPVDCDGEVMENIVKRLFMNNPAILQISFFNTTDGKHLKTIIQFDKEIVFLKPELGMLNTLKRYSEQGYPRIETVRDNENTFFYFIIKSTNVDMLGAIVIHSKTFVEQNLGASIQQIAQNRFSISITDTLAATSIYSTQTDTLVNMKSGFRQPMWYLPGKVASIALLSATIDQLVTKRAKRDSLLFYIMIGVVVAGLLFVVFTIRREVKLAEMKSEFVSNVSHEIRTPLALISMYTETLFLKRVKK